MAKLPPRWSPLQVLLGLQVHGDGVACGYRPNRLSYALGDGLSSHCSPCVAYRICRWSYLQQTCQWRQCKEEHLLVQSDGVACCYRPNCLFFTLGDGSSSHCSPCVACRQCRWSYLQRACQRRRCKEEHLICLAWLFCFFMLGSSYGV